MPIWSIKCECGGTLSERLSYSRRMDEYGGDVPCMVCGTPNKVRPTAPNLIGFGHELGIDGEISTADLHAAERAGKEVLTPDSPKRKAQRQRALERANKSAQRFGYKDVFEKRERFRGDEKQKWNYDQVAKQREIYHQKHGSKNKMTVEQAAKQVLPPKLIKTK